jgi:hypothetical protein
MFLASSSSLFRYIYLSGLSEIHILCKLHESKDNFIQIHRNIYMHHKKRTLCTIPGRTIYRDQDMGYKTKYTVVLFLFTWFEIWKNTCCITKCLKILNTIHSD